MTLCSSKHSGLNSKASWPGLLVVGSTIAWRLIYVSIPMLKRGHTRPSCTLLLFIMHWPIELFPITVHYCTVFQRSWMIPLTCLCFLLLMISCFLRHKKHLSGCLPFPVVSWTLNMVGNISLMLRSALFAYSCDTHKWTENPLTLCTTGN